MSVALKIVQLVEGLQVTRIGLSPTNDDISSALATTGGDVTAAAELLGLSTSSITLEGSRFNTATRVLFNGIDALSFTVNSDNLITATLPKSLNRKKIESVDVLGDSFHSGGRTRMVFEIGSTPRRTEGVVKLLQHFVKLLLTTPGTDIFRKTQGGGLLPALGTVVDPSNPGPLSARVMASINRARGQLVASQAVRFVPPEEKLRAVEVVRLSFDRPTLSLLLWLRLETMAGSKAFANVGLA